MEVLVRVVAAAPPVSQRLEIGPGVWAVFLAFVGVLLLVDILVVHREAHAPSLRRAAVESLGWIAVGVGFGLVVWLQWGGGAASEYFAGYLIEKSLSVDNVFVWAVILNYFAVPRQFQHRLLFWGVFGAFVLRAVFIFSGVALLNRLSWTIYLFGALLLFTALKLLVQGDDDEIDLSSSRTLRWFRRVVPSTDEYHGHHLLVRRQGRWVATPLLAVLVIVELSDLLFAVDSIPAILAVSRDAFIVFASNAFAILGLRALYFLLADLHGRFRYLNKGLAIILAFVGVKMLLSEGPFSLDPVHIPTGWSLAVIAAVLAIAIGASALNPEEEPQPESPSIRT